MSMSDCPKCWDTPCTCGYMYKDWSKEKRFEQASLVLGVAVLDLKGLVGFIVPEEHPKKGEGLL